MSGLTTATAPLTDTEQGIVLRGVTKRFGNHAAVRHVDLDIARGEFFTMLGPSGSGKTTLPRLIAGFEVPEVNAVVVGVLILTLAPIAYAARISSGERVGSSVRSTS